MLKLAWNWLWTPSFSPLQMTGANKSVMAFNLSYLFHKFDIFTGITPYFLSATFSSHISLPFCPLHLNKVETIISFVNILFSHHTPLSAPFPLATPLSSLPSHPYSVYAITKPTIKLVIRIYGSIIGLF
jgi:hypothetical protein